MADLMDNHELVESLRARITELEVLLARNVFFDMGSGEEALDMLGGYQAAVQIVVDYRARHAEPEEGGAA